MFHRVGPRRGAEAVAGRMAVNWRLDDDEIMV